LSTSPDAAAAVVEHPNGPEVWAALLDEFAAELQRQGSPAGPSAAPEAELDDTGAPWLPRQGGRAPLGAELEQVARTGRWDRSRYPGRSEAGMAVLCAAAARGYTSCCWHQASHDGARLGRRCGVMPMSRA